MFAMSPMTNTQVHYSSKLAIAKITIVQIDVPLYTCKPATPFSS